MIGDILGVQKSPTKDVLLLNEKLGAKSTCKKRSHSGIPRELLRLCGDSITSLFVDEQINEEQSSVSNSVQTWVWDRLDTSSHPSSIHLYQWRPSEEKEHNSVTPTAKSSMKSQQSASSESTKIHHLPTDHSSPGFEVSPQIVKYTSAMYSKLLSSLSKQWTQWETDYFFHLCNTYDLHFLVISDRYDPVSLLSHHLSTRDKALTSIESKHPLVATLQSMPTQAVEELLKSVTTVNPRTVCQLKHRYYSIARKILEYEHQKECEAIELRFKNLTASATPENVELLTQQRLQLLADARTEFSRHPLIKFQYNQHADQSRRSYLDQQYRHGNFKKIKEKEKDLCAEAMKVFPNSRDLKKNKKASGNLQSETTQAADDFVPVNIQTLQAHLIHPLKTGTILASQLMQQFGSSLLLQSSLQQNVPSIEKSHTAQSFEGFIESESSVFDDKYHRGQSDYYSSTNLSSSSKKHDTLIQAELEELNFGKRNLPLWPDYCDSEILEAFDALRLDIATMINYQNLVEQLKKEKAIWEAKISQLSDEGYNHVDLINSRGEKPSNSSDLDDLRNAQEADL